MSVAGSGVAGRERPGERAGRAYLLFAKPREGLLQFLRQAIELERGKGLERLVRLWEGEGWGRRGWRDRRRWLRGVARALVSPEHGRAVWCVQVVKWHTAATAALYASAFAPGGLLTMPTYFGWISTGATTLRAGSGVVGTTAALASDSGALGAPCDG